MVIDTKVLAECGHRRGGLHMGSTCNTASKAAAMCEEQAILKATREPTYLTKCGKLLQR